MGLLYNVPRKSAYQYIKLYHLSNDRHRLQLTAAGYRRTARKEKNWHYRVQPGASPTGGMPGIHPPAHGTRGGYPLRFLKVNCQLKYKI